MRMYDTKINRFCGVTIGKNRGSAEGSTRIAGFKVLNANHYTTEPFELYHCTLNFYLVGTSDFQRPCDQTVMLLLPLAPQRSCTSSWWPCWR